MPSTPSNMNVNAPFTPLGPMSTFDLAAAFNLPLKHANIITNIQKSAEDSLKTIPIPLIMPYLQSSLQNGFYVFDEESPCPDMACLFFGQKHFHCSKPRCYYITNREEVLLLHSRDFHDNIDIMEGFVYFDENIDCKLPSCPSNKSNKHFHCTRVGCNFSFIHYSLMSSHEEKHFSETGENVVFHEQKYLNVGDDEAGTLSTPEDSNCTSNSQMFLNSNSDANCEEVIIIMKNINNMSQL